MRRYRFYTFVLLLLTLSYIEQVGPCSFLGVSSNFAWAQESTKETLNGNLVVLQKPTDADDYVLKTLDQIRRQDQKVSSVILFHVGDSVPPQLAYLTDRLYAEGIRDVQFVRVAKKDFLNEITKQVKASSKQTPLFYEKLRYELEKSENFSLPSFSQSKFEKTKKQLLLRVKHFFGLINGLSWATYIVERSSKVKAAELGLGIVKNSISSVVLYNVLKSAELVRGDLNTVLPVIVSAGFGLTFDYFQQGNSAFKGQGKNFNFYKNKFVSNPIFLGVVGILHSLIVRQAITISTGIDVTMSHPLADFSLSEIGGSLSSIDFNFNPNVVVPYLALTALTSFKGFAAKFTAEMLLERLRQYKGQQAYIIGAAFWTTIGTCLQIVDQFQWGSTLRSLFLTMGIVGITVEAYWVYQNPASFLHRSINPYLKPFVRFLKGQKKDPEPSACETLLVLKK